MPSAAAPQPAPRRAALHGAAAGLTCAHGGSRPQQGAASSLARGLAEGEYSDPGNRQARYASAAGSANETRAALAVAVAWGYLHAAQAEPASHRLDREHGHALAAHARLSRHGSGRQAWLVPHPPRNPPRSYAWNVESDGEAIALAPAWREAPKWDRLRSVTTTRGNPHDAAPRGARSMINLVVSCKEVLMPDARMTRRLAGMLGTRLDDIRLTLATVTADHVLGLRRRTLLPAPA